RGSSASNIAPRLILFESQVGAAVLARARLERATGVAVHVRVEDALQSTVRLEAPIVVCIGNPPYRRRTALPTAFQALAAFKSRDAGVHAKNLHNDYVHFWRWALACVFEQRSGPGIVSFVTASSYLRGPAFAAMRRLLRSSLDE